MKKSIILALTFFSIFSSFASNWYGCLGGRSFWAVRDDNTGQITEVVTFGPCQGNEVHWAGFLVATTQIPDGVSSDSYIENRLNSIKVSDFRKITNSDEDLQIIKAIEESRKDLTKRYINIDNLNKDMATFLLNHQ